MPDVEFDKFTNARKVLRAFEIKSVACVNLEAERCRELAKAWDAKGQAAYADDYRERARRLG
jgi:hypothetical protein